VLGQFLHFGVVIDIEMLGLENVPVEVLILDLVAPKMIAILSLQRNRHDEQCQRKDERPTTQNHHAERKRTTWKRYVGELTHPPPGTGLRTGQTSHVFSMS